MAGVIKLTFFVFPQTKVMIGNENFIIVPDSACLNFQVHIARNHINIFPYTVIDLTRCTTESVLISFDIFPYVHTLIYYVLKIILKS